MAVLLEDEHSSMTWSFLYCIKH